MTEQQKLLRVLKLINLLGSPRRRTAPELADNLSVSLATLHRYLHLLKEVGFDIHKDEYHHHYLSKRHELTQSVLQFTLEEAQELHTLVRSTHSPLQQSLLNKIHAGSEIVDSTYNLEKARIGLCYRNLQQALVEKKQAILVQYFSENSNEIKDRKVEPIQLLHEKMLLEAFDISAKAIRHFKLERMEEVRVLDMHFKYAHKHQQVPTDPFGVADQQNIKIKLKLSQIGGRRLVEEYPACTSFMIPNAKGNYFEAEVNAGFKLLDRFLLSYCDEVQVLEPESLRHHLENKWKKKNGKKNSVRSS